MQRGRGFQGVLVCAVGLLSPSYLPFWEERGMLRDDDCGGQATAQLNRDLCPVETATSAARGT